MSLLPEVLLVQAVDGQQEQGQALTATVYPVAFPEPGHSQCGVEMAQTIAEFLNSRIPQVVAHWQHHQNCFGSKSC